MRELHSKTWGGEERPLASGKTGRWSVETGTIQFGGSTWVNETNGSGRTITRIPVYLRTTRAEILEVRERMFVQAAKVMGASETRIIFRHMLPVILPTLVTIATLDFAFVMLAESSLSFLGIGIQPPEITWGLRWSGPGPALPDHGLVAVVLARPRHHPDHAQPEPAVELDARRADPQQRWRLEIGGRKHG